MYPELMDIKIKKKKETPVNSNISLLNKNNQF